MSKQIVSTVFKAKDNISNAFKAMSKNSNRFGNGAEKAFKKASRGANKFRTITKSILAASAIQKTFSLLSQGVTETGRSFVNFDDALFSAASKFSDVDLTMKSGIDTFKKLGEAARKTGSQTQFTAEQSAQALDFLALAGFNAAQAMAALPGLADLATAAGISDFARVVDIASDSLGAFSLATKNTIQLEKNLTRVSDVFAKTQATTNTNIEAMFEAVTKGAPAFTAAGQSIETFSALIGSMANSGVKGAEAGTILRNVMLRLANPTKQAQKVLRQLNIQTKDSRNNFRNAIDIMADFEKGLKGMGNAQRSQALAVVFGARAITGVNILLKQGSKDLKIFEKGLINAGGTSKRIATIMRQSLGNRLKSLGSAANEVGFNVLDAFKVDGVNAIDAFTKALRGADIRPVVDGIRTAINIMSDLATALKSILVITSPLIAAMLAYKVVVLASAAASATLSATTAIYAAIRNGTILATAAQWAFNAAMTANPVGLIVGAVAGLVAALTALILKWDVVKAAFINGGKAVLDIFSSIFKIVKGIVSLGFGTIFGDPAISKAANNKNSFTPPNRREADAESQKFTGVLRFENKPDDVSFSSKSIGAPLISFEGLGAN